MPQLHQVKLLRLLSRQKPNTRLAELRCEFLLRVQRQAAEAATRGRLRGATDPTWLMWWACLRLKRRASRRLASHSSLCLLLTGPLMLLPSWRKSGPRPLPHPEDCAGTSRQAWGRSQCRSWCAGGTSACADCEAVSPSASRFSATGPSASSPGSFLECGASPKQPCLPKLPPGKGPSRQRRQCSQRSR